MFNFFKPKFNVSELTHHPERDGSIRIIIDHVTFELLRGTADLLKTILPEDEKTK